MGWLDDVDIAILAFVADNPGSSVTDGAKALYEPGDADELRKRDSMLRHRYTALAAAGLLATTPQGRGLAYRAAPGRLAFGHGLTGLRLGNRNCPPPALGEDYCIAIFLDDGVVIRSLDRLEARWK